MYNMMKKLISKRFYETANEAHGKLDVFFAVSRITAEQYAGLSALVENTYNAPEV